jgi:hypothetical protein
MMSVETYDLINFIIFITFMEGPEILKTHDTLE